MLNAACSHRQQRHAVKPVIRLAARALEKETIRRWPLVKDSRGRCAIGGTGKRQRRESRRLQATRLAGEVSPAPVGVLGPSQRFREVVYAVDARRTGSGNH